MYEVEKEKGEPMLVGEDIGLEKMMEYSGKSLIGKFYGTLND